MNISERPPPDPPPSKPKVPCPIIVGKAIASYRDRNAKPGEKARDFYVLSPGDDVIESYIADDSTVEAEGIELRAEDGSAIEAVGIGGSLAIAAGATSATAVSLAVVVADNYIANEVRSYIDDSEVDAPAGGVKVEAETLEGSRIWSQAVAVSVAGAISGVGGGFAGGV